MRFVLHACVAACWLFENEDHPRAAEALARIRTDEARVPSLWWFEVRSTLLVNERCGRAHRERYRRGLSRLAIIVDRTPGEDVLALARRHRLTAYSAAYLELARREDLASATLDQKLADAAHAERIALIGGDPG